MENKPLERWHGAHHYSDRLHWVFIIFLFLSVATLIWSYYGLSNSRFASKNNPSPAVSQPTPVPTTKPTCTPRPSCFDTVPRCLMPETSDMCPPSPTPSPKSNGVVFCTQDAKQCPDGAWVGRSGPNCEFACPTK